MNQQSITLTGMNQLADYTHIRRFISISYRNENANVEFGNYEASRNLNDNAVVISEFDVDHIDVIVNENETSYVLFSATSELQHTIAFSDIYDFHRFHIMTINGVPTLVYYQMYVQHLNNDDKDDTQVVNPNNN
jgi:hypothetical protein